MILLLRSGTDFTVCTSMERALGSAPDVSLALLFLAAVTAAKAFRTSLSASEFWSGTFKQRDARSA